MDSTVNRWYVRCVDCLSIGAVETNPMGQRWICGVCAGRIEVMGKVVVDHLETEKTRSACDARCTHARGPLCVCHCGCVNHGTGRVVKIVVKQDIPTIEFMDAEDALKNATEYRTRFKEINDLMTNNASKIRYYELYRTRDMLHKVVAARKHVTRMERLAKAFAMLPASIRPDVQPVSTAPLFQGTL